MTATFAEVRRSAPNIHVSENGIFGPAMILEPQCMDKQYDQHCYGEHYTTGDGSLNNPLQYKSAAPVSAHYGIVDLWYRYHHLTCQPNSPPVFIKINDWFLVLRPEGVVAEDGHFTILV